jgi:hypothetical protein
MTDIAALHRDARDRHKEVLAVIETFTNDASSGKDSFVRKLYCFCRNCGNLGIVERHVL